jgi:hypothetical protein
MARKCPPGVICVQNALFVSMFVILVILLAFFIYRSTLIQDKRADHRMMNNVSSWFDMSNWQGLFTRPNYSYSNIENDVLLNPYTAPHRDESVFNNSSRGGDLRGGIPINVRTQGFDSSYRQVGILTRQNGGDTIMALMGRPLLTNRDKWQFYTMNENNIKLPIVSKGKSCTNEYGCDNLYNGDSVYVEGLKDVFKVTMYDNAIAKYIPFI